MSHAKIRPTHLRRRAVVYLRQSTMKQVHEHSESTLRQYSLSQRALELGWPSEDIEIIDEDLGQSGTSTQSRSGFKRLAEEISRGRVGAIFSLEVSRLSRSSADWHRLLDLCGWTDVLIADEHAVFSPNDPNDRLLLGLKGQMSEAERYWMRLRLHGARDNKARRGELRVRAPVGYVWDSDLKRLRLDPDAEVQQTVRLMFERFGVEGSAGAVMAFFIEHGLEWVQRLPGGELVRGRLCRGTAVNILHNPIYAGAYVYGRRECRTVFANGELKRNRVTHLPMESWKVCLKDHHPAYISWEQFMTNQDKLDANRNRRHESRPTAGAARGGAALLQGLVLCGRCGYRMTVQQGGQAAPRYTCTAQIDQGRSTKVCWSVAARAIDASVGAQFLEVCQPPQLELSLAVTKEVERQAGELEQQWKSRLARARYEASLAERRYKAVDPDNRVVAETLEGEWEEKLRQLEDLEQRFEDARSAEKVELTDADRARILSLANDLPRIWNAGSTTQVQRKNLLRLAVEQVTLTPVDVPRRSTGIQILWHIGSVSRALAERPRHPGGARTPRSIVEEIRAWVSQGHTDREIAAVLNGRGVLSAKGSTWTDQSVRGIRKRNGLVSRRAPPQGQRHLAQRADGFVSLRGVAERFGVSTRAVRSWIERGLLSPAEGGGRGRVQWFDLDPTTVDHLAVAALAGCRQRVVEGGEV